MKIKEIYSTIYKKERYYEKNITIFKFNFKYECISK